MENELEEQNAEVEDQYQEQDIEENREEEEMSPFDAWLEAEQRMIDYYF